MQYLRYLIAKEISTLSRYSNRVVQWKPLPHDTGELLEKIDCSEKKSITEAFTAMPVPEKQSDNACEVALLNGVFNHHLDIQELLLELHSKLSRDSRAIAVVYNPYLRWIFALASFLKLRKGEMPSTFITSTDLENLAKLSQFEVVRMRPVGYCPFRLLGLGCLINFIFPMLPLFRWLGFVAVVTLRPVKTEKTNPSLTIVIPARNEKGNIENAILRMPDFGTKDIEIIFVEGHSSDQTWEEILRVQKKYSDRYKILAFQQTGKGKNDAVRLGFSHATKELLTILDADLTMPPELLTRFYRAYTQGLADFINGSRLVYPMEGEAMRFLNRLGNAFFAKALSSVLNSRIGDSLCGTKLVSRRNYQRILKWRGDFGDFDPFGDFELLFPAAILGMGIVDIPIRYRSRTYGSTNISRFRHGFMLLKMTLIGLFRIRAGRS